MGLLLDADEWPLVLSTCSAMLDVRSRQQQKAIAQSMSINYHIAIKQQSMQCVKLRCSKYLIAPFKKEKLREIQVLQHSLEVLPMRT
ncbi:hypothetical protein Y886_13905 [Xanthomonas hyacinthi DSM 19077]|nr:hypothetical protein Y886_13905 [Xanthomonas hyacinthi DSM 19077]